MNLRQETVIHFLSVCRNERLRFVSDRLSGWEDEKRQVPLEELLGSTLENVRHASGETLLQSTLLDLIKHPGTGSFSDPRW